MGVPRESSPCPQVPSLEVTNRAHFLWTPTYVILLCLAIKWIPQEAFNQTQSSSPLRDPLEGKNSTSSTRILRPPDATSAAWYILTIIGIYGLIFIFQLASNILRKNERSLEDIYYSNLTSELKRKGFQGEAAQCSSLIVSSADARRPQQLGLEPKCEDSRLHVGTQVVP